MSFQQEARPNPSESSMSIGVAVASSGDAMAHGGVQFQAESYDGPDVQETGGAFG